MKCNICEIGCTLKEGETGRCGMYHLNGAAIEELYPDRYLTVFPINIETMPTLHYNPRGKFLQISTIGCNFRCGGCVSESLTAGMSLMSGGLHEMTPVQVVEKAMEENCIGIVFCVNDPIVSLNTFIKVATIAQERGLHTGCSTNGFFTEESLDRLIPFLSFINIGFKGFTDEAYRACGAPGIALVLRNMSTLHKRGIHVEAAVMYTKGRENEVHDLAEHIASISKDIPYQIMRFVPFGDAAMEDEPSMHEAEILCDKIRETLPFTYLFNSPGTDRLNTICPECGSAIVEREFFGAMGARVLIWRDKGICDCGYQLPFKGNFYKESFHEHGFFGGYRTTRALEIIHSIITSLNPVKNDLVYSTWSEIMKNDFLHEFHKNMQDPYKYKELIKFFAGKTETEDRGKELIAYMENILVKFEKNSSTGSKPRVYYAMGYPLFAINAERIESNLVTIAGGYCVNKDLTRQGKPGVTITASEFADFNADYIFISGFFSCPLSDFYRYCSQHNLTCPALENNRVYAIPPLWDFGSLRWILGLTYIAGILFPEKYPEAVEEEAERFYRLFYNVSYKSIKPNRSFYRIK